MSLFAPRHTVNKESPTPVTDLLKGEARVSY